MNLLTKQALFFRDLPRSTLVSGIQFSLIFMQSDAISPRVQEGKLAEQGCKMIFMRAQISIETETIVKFESLQTLYVSPEGVTTPKTFTATTTSRVKGLIYIAQMELSRTNQNKNKTALLGPS